MANKNTSLNSNNNSDNTTHIDNVQHALKEYEKEAKIQVGGLRKTLRKAEPRKPLIVRVREAMKMQEELEKEKQQSL